MKRLLPLSAVLLGGTLVAAADSGNLVIDARHHGAPLPGVIFTVTDSRSAKHTSSSDRDGRATFVLPAGEARLRGELTGMVSSERTFTIDAGNIHELSVDFATGPPLCTLEIGGTGPAHRLGFAFVYEAAAPMRLRVTHVARGYPAEKAGLRAGDRIVSIDARSDFDDAAEARDYVLGRSREQTMLFEVERGDGRALLQMKPVELRRSRFLRHGIWIE